jgi:Uma2 family endonuclease
VTSPSTEADDRGRKFTLYRGLTSLREYLLVSQQQPEVETYFRQPDGIWAIGPRYATLQTAVGIGSLKIEIPMAEIYAGVEFVPPPLPTAPVE